jgi:hypothetical protein
VAQDLSESEVEASEGDGEVQESNEEQSDAEKGAGV